MNAATIERLYILDGGLALVADGSRVSPGTNVGVPITMSCNAYLIQHRSGWLMWDTGAPDFLVSEPEGRLMANGIRGIVRKTIASQLAEIGVRPDDVDTLVVSHAHFDHIGNAGLFPKARWIVQKAERDAMFGSDPSAYGYLPELYEGLRASTMQIVEGDHDVFGDGSVNLLFTPGHTLGHSSLLVRLVENGPVLLSADVVHNRDNFANRRVPVFNADQRASVASMDKADAVLRAERGKFWINHDTAQSATLPHAPLRVS